MILYVHYIKNRAECTKVWGLNQNVNLLHTRTATSDRQYVLYVYLPKRVSSQRKPIAETDFNQIELCLMTQLFSRMENFLTPDIPQLKKPVWIQFSHFMFDKHFYYETFYLQYIHSIGTI